MVRMATADAMVEDGEAMTVMAEDVPAHEP
jgi:hypothetical protein